MVVEASPNPENNGELLELPGLLVEKHGNDIEVSVKRDLSPSERALLRSRVVGILELLDNSQSTGSLELVNETVAKPDESETTKTPTIFTKESFNYHLEYAQKGYDDVVEVINRDRSDEDKIKLASGETIAQEFEAWYTDDIRAYVEATQAGDKSLSYTLVATPNVVANQSEIKGLANDFGETTDEATGPTIINNRLVDSYTAEQLSGTNPNNGKSVVFSLIANKTDQLAYLPGEEQPLDNVQTRTRNQQTEDWIATHAFLQAPSVLEGLTYLYALRAKKALADYEIKEDPYNLTLIPYYNLPPRFVHAGVYRQLLCSYLYKGHATLGQADVPEDMVRLALKKPKSILYNF